MNSLAAYEVTGNVGETFTFWVCAVVGVGGALGMLLSRKAVHCALFLASTMISLAVLYVTMEAPFLGVVQVIVYTGAIMMLFLFVLMLVGVDASESLRETIAGQRIAAAFVAIALVALLFAALGTAVTNSPTGLVDANEADSGNVQGIARLIFGRYVVAFEVTSALLVTAALGAMVLAFRERYEPRSTQRDRSLRRFRDGGHVTPLPGPGVYARHNAVGTPALLPDGSPSDLSVPEPVRGISTAVASTAEVSHLASGRPSVGSGVVESADEQLENDR